MPDFTYQNVGGTFTIFFGIKKVKENLSLEEARKFIEENQPKNKENQLKEWKRKRELKKLRNQKSPKIVCLCGSPNFWETFHNQELKLTKEGTIVLSILINEPVLPDTEQKKRLDRLRKYKIDFCDEVLILNIGGYIDNSTRREIAYAEIEGKLIRYLEPNIVVSKQE